MTSQTDALLPSAKEVMQKIAIAEAEEAEIGRGTKIIERARKNRFIEVHIPIGSPAPGFPAVEIEGEYY